MLTKRLWVAPGAEHVGQLVGRPSVLWSSELSLFKRTRIKSYLAICISMYLFSFLRRHLIYIRLFPQYLHRSFQSGLYSSLGMWKEKIFQCSNGFPYWSMVKNLQSLQGVKTRRRDADRPTTGRAPLPKIKERKISDKHWTSMNISKTQWKSLSSRFLWFSEGEKLPIE